MRLPVIESPSTLAKFFYRLAMVEYEEYDKNWAGWRDCIEQGIWIPYNLYADRAYKRYQNYLSLVTLFDPDFFWRHDENY